jgi:hypothetical protein
VGADRSRNVSREHHAKSGRWRSAASFERNGGRISIKSAVKNATIFLRRPAAAGVAAQMGASDVASTKI